MTEFQVGKDGKGGSFFFQVPKDFDVVSMGKKFKKMGREMEQGGRSGTNWKITEDIKDFHHLLYGQSGFRTQGNNKQAKIRTTNQNNSDREEGKNNKKAKIRTKNGKQTDTEDDEIRSV